MSNIPVLHIKLDSLKDLEEEASSVLGHACTMIALGNGDRILQACTEVLSWYLQDSSGKTLVWLLNLGVQILIPGQNRHKLGCLYQ